MSDNLQKFGELHAKLKKLEAREHITASECLRSERLMYRMAAIRDDASLPERKLIARCYGWRSQ